MAEDVSNAAPSDNRGDRTSPNTEEQQRIILEIASRVLESGNRDPQEVFDVVRKLGLRAHLVNNLRAYSTRALFRVRRRPEIQEQQLIEAHCARSLSDNSYVERIEAQILVRELLDGLPASDREIFVRSMNGETCPEIDAHMDLKPRTAEIRLKVCKNALRRAVQKKLEPQSR